MIRWARAQALRGDRGSGAPQPDLGASVIANAWNDPLTLLLLGGFLVVVGIVLGRVVRAARARRPRNSR